MQGMQGSTNSRNCKQPATPEEEEVFARDQVSGRKGGRGRCVSRPLPRTKLRALNEFNDTCAGVTGERWGGREAGRQGGREGGGQKSGCTAKPPTEPVVECGLGQQFAPLPSFAPLQQGGLVTSELDYVLMQPHRQVWGCFFVAFFSFACNKNVVSRDQK